MSSFCINFILVVMFSGLIVLLFKKNRKRLSNALIIFYALVIIKFVFLVVWTSLHTQPFDWSYLQFPDEFRYAVTFKIGDPIANGYDILTYYLRAIGFSIINLKMVNILLSSFAVTRLCSLSEYVRDKNRYTIYLLTIGGLFYLHIIYYSVFVLKDALFFYASVEFLIQLIHRREKNNWMRICFAGLLLIAIRKVMILIGCVFLFDRNWKLKKKRLLIAIPLLVVFLENYGTKFYDYIAAGLTYSLKMEGGRRELKAFAITGIHNYWGLYLNLIMANIRRAVSVVSQADITNMAILFLEWLIVLYFFIVKKSLRKIIPFWPLLLVAVVYFVSGIITLYNIRYNIFPFTFLLYILILIHSGIFKERVISGYSRN